MNDDDRLDSYFHGRADAIAVDPGDPAEAAGRAADRQRSRRALGSGLVAGVVLLGAVAVIGSRRAEEDFGTAGAPDGTAVTAPEAAAPAGDLIWTTVEVPDGLGYTMTSPVTAEDGAQYQLSTEPGAIIRDFGAPNLYRSTDGKSWEHRELPAGLWASSLGSSGGQLYAVGTAPAGGGIDAVLATSGDGGDTWSTSTIPMPESALAAQYPNEVFFSNPQVARGPAGLVAAVGVYAIPRTERLLPRVGDVADAAAEITETGITVFDLVADPACALQPPALVPAPTTSGPTTILPEPANLPTDQPRQVEVPVPSPTTTVMVGDGPIVDGPPGTMPDDESIVACEKFGRRDIKATYTWAQLGLEPELQALLEGKVRTFHAPDGGGFTEVPLPLASGNSIATLASTDDGFRLLAGNGRTSTYHGFASSDGVTWVAQGQEVFGFPQQRGTIGGRPAVHLSGGDDTLAVAGPDGWESWSLSEALAAVVPGARSGVSSLAMGPLGVVAVVQPNLGGRGGAGAPVVVSSSDGKTFAATALDELAQRGAFGITGITMNADAVTIRLASPGRVGAPAPPPAQTLLVGTRA